MLLLMALPGFYLITTDILGPYGVGFSMGTLGWGPGTYLSLYHQPNAPTD